MRCRYCQQDVDDPCHDVQEMQQRAAHHVDRCENALRTSQGMNGAASRQDTRGRT
jgi:hypothetical protein